jgi:hypothetical protein
VRQSCARRERWHSILFLVPLDGCPRTASYGVPKAEVVVVANGWFWTVRFDRAEDIAVLTAIVQIIHRSTPFNSLALYALARASG